MSRIDDFEEMLGEDSGSPKTKWFHDYEIDGKNKIYGSFVYKDQTHVLKVTYKIALMQNLERLSLISEPENSKSIQARLSKKENPDMLESLVEAESPEKYQKDNMIPYIALLEELCQQIAGEECEEFKPYKDAVRAGIKKIIQKVKPLDYKKRKSPTFFESIKRQVGGMLAGLVFSLGLLHGEEHYKPFSNDADLNSMSQTISSANKKEDPFSRDKPYPNMIRGDDKKPLYKEKEENYITGGDDDEQD